MDDKTKTDFILLFNQGFEEVVIPEIEGLRKEMNQRFDKLETRVDRIESRVNNIEVRVDSIDRKLDRSLDNDIVQTNRLDEIEAVPAIAHQLHIKKSK